MGLERINWFRFSSLQAFYPLAGTLIPWFAALTMLCMTAGLYIGFFASPTDYQQGEAYRISRPCASSLDVSVSLCRDGWLGRARSGTQCSTVLYDGTGGGTHRRDVYLLALLTGALWGKPTWGTWWVWDARLTSELILLFQYLGFIPPAGGDRRPPAC